MLLLLWLILGAGLRLADLDVKPPWTEEFNTIVLSLGNSFKSVPLDRIISFQDLIAPLKPNAAATLGDVVRQVAIEDRQPPIYLALAHLWMQLFPSDGGLVSLWGARALPAVIGILTIPGSYFCSYFIFRSPLIAHLTAAMFAVSPYGVYIAQEARDYSLAIFWVTISISCLASACIYLSRQQKLPLVRVCAWIVVNNLALATNYLSSIALMTEALVLVVFYLWQIRQIATKSESDRSFFGIAIANLLHPSWQRLDLVVLGTMAGGAWGWWFLAHTYAPSPSVWIDNSPHKSIEIVNPLFQLIGRSDDDDVTLTCRSSGIAPAIDALGDAARSQSPDDYCVSDFDADFLCVGDPNTGSRDTHPVEPNTDTYWDAGNRWICSNLDRVIFSYSLADWSRYYTGSALSFCLLPRDNHADWLRLGELLAQRTVDC